MIYTYNDKIKIKSQIEKLSYNDWIQIYLILKNEKENFTINKNGLLFDLINISNSTLDKINNYINQN